MARVDPSAPGRCGARAHRSAGTTSLISPRQDFHRREPLPNLPEYEIYAIRYAKQDKRSEGHMFLGGDHHKMIQGLDFFTYALRGNGRTWIVDTGMTSRQSERMGRK